MPYISASIVIQLLQMDIIPYFSDLAKEGYEWVTKEYSDEKNDVYNLISKIGKTIEDFKVIHSQEQELKSDQIPIIMTGEPNDYKSKGDFLRCHPEYRNTGSWKGQ